MRILLSVFSFLLLTGVSCNQEQQPQQRTPTPEEREQSLIDMNKNLLSEESARIDAYVKQKGWSVQKTGTGLRYYIYKDGAGEMPKEGAVVAIHYEVSLLDGTICYTSRESGPREFLVGQDYIETGLHEGVQLMKVGDKAKFVLPSHLAHGLAGDRNKIPARASVVYDIELLSFR